MRRTPRVRTGVLGGVALLAVAATAACGSQADGAEPAATPPVSEAAIADLFTGWNAALATLDANKVADRYAADAVLLPTVSNKVRTDRAGITDYFTHFLAVKPQGQILQSHVSVVDADTAIDTGVYRFTLREAAGERHVDARYTFVYELRDGQWLIVNHHSSAMPE